MQHLGLRNVSVRNYCVWVLCLRDVSEEDVRLRGSRVNDVSVSDVRVRNLWWRDVSLQHRRVRDVPVQAVCLPNVCLQNFSRLKCPCKGFLCKSCHFAFVRKVIMRDLCLQDSVQDVLLRDYRLQDVHLRNVCKPNVHMRDVSIQNVLEIYVSFKMLACCMSVCKNSVLR